MQHAGKTPDIDFALKIMNPDLLVCVVCYQVTVGLLQHKLHASVFLGGDAVALILATT